jgi:hypothetical protein
LAIAWLNVAYNQPPHLGFFLGHNMEKPPTPKIYEVKAESEQSNQENHNKLYL